ncbi:MAG: hypothetical protein WCC60_16435 [Ilumatobacteraceae bacterium]
MNTSDYAAGGVLLVVALFAASCNTAGRSTSSGTPSVQASPTEAGSAAVTASPPTVPATTAPTTAAPTSSVPAGPPTFDPDGLGDNRDLPSFVATVTVANTNSGQLSENSTTTGYIKDPFSAYELSTFSYDGVTDGARTYFVDGRSYEENISGDWYINETEGAPNYLQGGQATSALAGVASAQFIGVEQVDGVPANHFVFDETSMASYSAYSPSNPSPDVEGDFYLAVDGNYLLAAHYKETSPQRTYEVTETVSAIGQVTEISLPADLLPMKEAFDLGVELGSLVPPGGSLSEMIRYRSGIGVDYYTYSTATRNNAEFIDFYRNLPPTNGWTVTHIGHIRPHLEQIDCEVTFDCVIIKNGDSQIVLSFGGSVTLENDREHVFSPL